MFTCSHGALYNDHAGKNGTRKQTPAQDLDTTVYKSTLLLLQPHLKFTLHSENGMNNFFLSLKIIYDFWTSIFGGKLSYFLSLIPNAYLDRLRNKITSARSMLSFLGTGSKEHCYVTRQQRMLGKHHGGR